MLLFLLLITLTTNKSIQASIFVEQQEQQEQQATLDKESLTYLYTNCKPLVTDESLSKIGFMAMDNCINFNDLKSNDVNICDKKNNNVLNGLLQMLCLSFLTFLLFSNW